METRKSLKRNAMALGSAVMGMALLAGVPVYGQCGSTAAASCGESPRSSGLVAYAGETSAAPKSIVGIAADAGSFKTLVAAVKAAGLVETLKGKGPFTVFAPTDEAFAKLPAGTVETLLKPENREKLVSILTYHVVPSRVNAERVVRMSGLRTLNGQRIDVRKDESGVRVDEARILKTDIAASNGIIHVIDSVILPSSADIVETAVKAGSFNTLAAAAKAAGLVETLKGKGPFTVFAPTDEAFAKLPEGTVADLLKPENREKLAAILKYHVVPGRVFSRDARRANNAKTVQGQHIGLRTESGKLFVDGAQVTASDIDASNGVIHVIDKVILPNSADIVATAINAGSFKTLAKALTEANLVEALQGEGPFTVFAPTDEAFAKLPAGTVETLLKPENVEQLKKILLYHVVPGRVHAADAIKASRAKTLEGSSLTIADRDGAVSVNGSRVLRANLDASNGVIHVVDRVLLPAS